MNLLFEKDLKKKEDFPIILIINAISENKEIRDIAKNTVFEPLDENIDLKYASEEPLVWG